MNGFAAFFHRLGDGKRRRAIVNPNPQTYVFTRETIKTFNNERDIPLRAGPPITDEVNGRSSKTGLQKVLLGNP